MTTITLTNLNTLSDKDFDLLSKYLAKKGIEFTINDTTAPEKTTKEKSAPKSKKEKSAKKSSDFDRVTYQRIASVLGCYGKHGVWKSCRQWVYAVMDGTMTLEEAQSKVKALKVEKGWA